MMTINDKKKGKGLKKRPDAIFNITATKTPLPTTEELAKKEAMGNRIKDLVKSRKEK